MNYELDLRPKKLLWCHNLAHQITTEFDGEYECIKIFTDHAPAEKEHCADAPTTWTFFRNTFLLEAPRYIVARELVILLRMLFAARWLHGVPHLKLTMPASPSLIFCMGAVVRDIPMVSDRRDTIISFSDDVIVC